VLFRSPGAGADALRGAGAGADAARRRESAEDATREGEPLEEELLRLADQIGVLLRQVGRASDAIGRLGQSEFAVIAPGTSSDGAVRLVKRLGGRIEASPIAVRGGERTVRLRAGYCAVPDFADSPVDAVELLLRATTALRDLQKTGSAERIRAFDSASLQSSN
jgi:GGDEF domain-containing protein